MRASRLCSASPSRILLSAARPLALAALAGLLLASAAGIADAALPSSDLRLDGTHGVLALYGFLLPALAAFTAHALDRVLGRQVPARKGALLAALWFGGTLVLAGTALFPDHSALEEGVRAIDRVHQAVAGLGALLLLAAAGMTTGALLKAVPKRKESVVDVARDPLTKGDDACAAHLRFAQFFLPLGVLLDAWTRMPGWGDSPIQGGLGLAGVHLLAVHALVTCYGLAHLWVPRLSGVPAIAAGAIKGELHSTLLGLVFLLAGFLLDVRGLVIAGGAFAFLGAFTFMGVIGANIMRNKSKTQRVTPEFSYIPWAFTAVFWLMSGVLLGIFLNAVPDVYAEAGWSLRFTHVHIALLGGVGQLLLALAWRLRPADRGTSPPPFHGVAKLAYFALNTGLVLMLAGHFDAHADPGTVAPRLDNALFLAGAALVILAIAASFIILERHGREAARTGAAVKR